MTIRGYELSARLIALVVGILLLIGIVAFALTQCSSRKTAEKQAEVSQGQAGASIGAGAEAGNTLSNVTANVAATDQAVVQGQSEVRAAPEAEKGAAAVNAACRFKANRDKPQCRGAVR